MACYDEATTRWLAADGPHRTLVAEVDAAFAEVRALAT